MMEDVYEMWINNGGISFGMSLGRTPYHSMEH